MPGNILGYETSLNETVENIDDSLLVMTETGGTVTTDGTEQNVYINNAPSGIYDPEKFLLDFTNHTAGETVVVREYYRIKTGGNLILEKETTYAGLVSPELVSYELKENRYGVKITVEKTGGANKAYDWEIIYKI